MARTLHLPVPRTGSRGDGGACALAGSRWVWFDTVNVRRTGGAEGHAHPGDLAPELRDRLSRLRPAVCGLSLDVPRVMGILNVTPDSFSDGGRAASLADALARGRALAAQADILDIGGESTRPGSRAVPAEEEIARTIPVIRALRAEGIATPISIDTRKAAVAGAALEAGADMVNDVSALGFDADMARVVAEAGVPVVLMHAKGSPETMQDDPRYDDVLREVLDFLAERIARAQDAGIAAANIVADPGIGFGKTLTHNMELLQALSAFHDLGVPLLLGASRKRFIGTLSGVAEAERRLAGSLAVALHGARQGAQMLRVHDAAETRQALALELALAGVLDETGPEAAKEAP
jgi:dihydropteroate synthase